MKKIISLVLLLTMAASVKAAGFRVALQSAKQLGMAHVGVGMQLGAESIFFNPGAFALAEKGNISISGNAVLANTQFNSPGSTITADLEDNVGTPFGAYGSFKINDDVMAGLGVYTPFGNKVEWPDGWTGRGVSQLTDLKTIFVQPTASFKLSEKVGFGMGFILGLGEVTLNRKIPSLTTSPEAEVTFQSDGYQHGWGFNTGLFYQADEDLSLGINYRSEVKVLSRNGDVSYENIPALASPQFQATTFDANLPLPAELSFGAGWKPMENLTLGADMNYTFWSSYKELRFKYDRILGGAYETVVPQDWADSWTVRLGGQYMVSEKLNLRAGTYYDFTPIPDRTLSSITPDEDRLGLSFGFGYNPNEKISIDGAILSIRGRERTVLASDNQFGFAQRYRVGALVPSLGFNYSFN